ncbi:MAG TPA: MFS transporter [Devosia sp.]|nr:MFS transporter [Devosia sp.]
MAGAAQSQSGEEADERALGGLAAIWAVAAEMAVIFGLTTLPTPLYRDYARAFGFPQPVVTLIYASYVVGTIGSLLFVGRLSDQIGRRKVSLMGVGVALAAALLFLFATDLWLLFAARFVTGVSVGLCSGTAVAWMREVHGEGQGKPATLSSVSANLFGLGFGPLLSGVLADFAPWPLRLSFAVYLVPLLGLAASVLRTRETVEHRKPAEQASLKPRLGVPHELVGRFVAPALICFVVFSLVGFYSAIVPRLMVERLSLAAHWATGGLVFGLFAAAMLAAWFWRDLASRYAMLWGAAAMLPALVLLTIAQAAGSLVALLGATLFGGMAQGLGYRGVLEVSNQMAPAGQRAELVSLLIICGNLGLAVPVLGVGGVSVLAGPATANLVFAGVIALFSLVGLGFGFFRGEGSGKHQGSA